MIKIWNRLFLDERPSISLSFFRIAVAVALGCYVLPTFLHLPDNYFHTAFKTYNFNFFTPGAIELVQKSPDGVVALFVLIFCVSWFFFLTGLYSQISCIIVTFCCYYFYALNYFVLGTLTWDILLVTLFLMCITPYHGDYFSLDALRRKDAAAYKRKRPYFLQRLLQLQIAFCYFYTALYKVYPGNWLKDNPLFYLMNYPVEGVTKNFMIKEFMSVHPEWCYFMGVLIVCVEFSMIFLLFYPPTRLSAIYLGIVFHITLILTLDVPAIFFFLFPPQLLLFIHPDHVVRWIEDNRAVNNQGRQLQVIFDGHCQFCQASVEKLQIMDLFGVLRMVDYQKVSDIKEIHPSLTKERAHSQLQLIEASGKLYEGFWCFRRLCLVLPMLYPVIPILFFPGSGIVGPAVYRWMAKNRYLLHFNKTCTTNACFR